MNRNCSPADVLTRESDHPFEACSVHELEDILEASHDGIFITDGRGNVLRVNSAWERICGFSRADIIGRNAQELVNEKLYSESAVMAAIRTQKAITILLEMTKGEKAGQKIMATAIPILGLGGEIKRVVANIRDITEILYLKELLGKTQELNTIYATELEQVRLQQLLNHSNVIARSQATRNILQMATQVAKVDSTVLVTGESGVGKEVIANTIHRLSPRSEGPLIKINCGSIPENLLETELFGYESGAFTGARKQGKPGLFEMAQKGTLFLDEIGDITFNLQAKLLRALQDREIMRVGGLKPVPVDVRIITATNKDLEEMVRQGSFRSDLFYRLNVVSIRIPPLRDRREDIPLLAIRFVEKINERYSLNKRLSPDVIDGFLMYPWPGNIRELENVTEQMIVMTKEDEVSVSQLPACIRNCIVPGNEGRRRLDRMPLKDAIEQTERQILEQALRKHRSTRSVARALAVNQSTVVRKIQKYGLSSLCREMVDHTSHA
ncbi:MAG: sigma 54-interacting transcriptional regulator [Syntrophaceae bacterium]|nr:sigma 54-interacting transcriptional regulator [Syntrophaceae bacterium]